MKLFVYGTLMSGFYLNKFLANKGSCEADKVRGPYIMLDLGAYPGVHKTTGTAIIIGETYNTCEDELAMLDRIEGGYIREQVTTEKGHQAYIYILMDAGRARRTVPNNDWRAHIVGGVF